MTIQTFPTAQATRDFLAANGFPTFRKGVTRGSVSANGKVASFGMCLLSATGQSSKGASAAWGWSVRIEKAIDLYSDAGVDREIKSVLGVA
jgi:hypothetical protein